MVQKKNKNEKVSGLNILHVLSVPFSIPYFIGNQIKYFISLGYKEFIICSNSEILEYFSNIYEFKYLPVDISRKITIWLDIKAIYKTIKFIKHNNIDIVVGHTPKGAFISMIAAFIAGVSTRIYFRHGLVYQTSKGLKRYLLISIDRLSAKLSTKIVCVSPSLYTQSLKDKLNKESKQVLLHKGTCNGIDTNRFCKDSIDLKNILSLKSKYHIQATDFIVGYSGRLVKDKGIIELIDSLDVLTNKYQNIKLLLVGMFDSRDTLPDYVIERIRNNSRIIITGSIDYSIMELYYRLMDIFILPSYREGFPTSTLEASSMELPIITTRVTGCIDSIIENETGLFIEHSAESIVNTIEKLYLDKSLRKYMGINGRNFVRNNFSQEIIWNEIHKLYYK